MWGTCAAEASARRDCSLLARRTHDRAAALGRASDAVSGVHGIRRTCSEGIGSICSSVRLWCTLFIDCLASQRRLCMERKVKYSFLCAPIVKAAVYEQLITFFHLSLHSLIIILMIWFRIHPVYVVQNVYYSGRQYYRAKVPTVCLYAPPSANTVDSVGSYVEITKHSKIRRFADPRTQNQQWLVHQCSEPRAGGRLTSPQRRPPCALARRPPQTLPYYSVGSYVEVTVHCKPKNVYERIIRRARRH